MITPGSDMEFKVFIPAAGTGSRLGSVCQYLNKSLVSVGARPAICHIIDKFSPQTRFVIALGYKGSLLRQFLQLAYADRQFEFVEVSPFEGPGSGLGLTVLACREHLQCPFVFCSCDTIVSEAIPAPVENWMGYSDVANAGSYRTINLVGESVREIREKRAVGAQPHAYIGLAGIRDYATFWKSMTSGAANVILEQGESHGLRSLLNRGSRARRFNWYDTGSVEGLAATRVAFHPEGAPNILPKSNEDIWFVGGNVIKFSADTRFIADRVKRSRRLQGYCPEIVDDTENMYKYRRVEGDTLSRIVTIPLFRKLLDHAQKFWVVKSLDTSDARAFESTCMDFYRTKTYQRVEQFHTTFDRKDSAIVINGILVPSAAELLGRVDWAGLSKGLPGNFHGDFHFENILYDQSSDRFTYLDWRQNFGGQMDIGDIYYDFAKLNHGLIVCHELISKNQFEVVETPDGVRFELLRKQVLVDCEVDFGKFLEREGYDVKRVKILTAIIYLNIAALHHYPYSLLLYYLGRSLLAQYLVP